jgi:hypothetical protein
MGIISKAVNRWREVILITIFIKLLLFIVAFATNGHGKPELFFEIWVQWDGPHYLDIAKNWYVTDGLEKNWIVFYPLYPLLVRLFNLLSSNLSLSSIYISLIFSLSSSILLYELCLQDFKKGRALLAVWFLNIYPAAFFLQASYTESLFLTTSLASFLLFRKNSSLSGVFGALSTLTRVNGLILIPSLLFETKSLRQLWSLLMFPFGFLTYLFINYSVFSDPFYFTKPLFEYWHKKVDFPWNGVKTGFDSFSGFSPAVQFAYKFEFAAVALCLIVGIYSFFKIRKSYGVYTLLNLLLITSTSFILSAPRYAMVLFPIYIFLSGMNKWLVIPASVTSLVLLLYFTGMYTQGGWAF